MPFRNTENRDIVNLENCEDEPIHVPGSIQPHGFLVAIDSKDDSIVFCSANTVDFTGLRYEQLLGKTSELILGEEQKKILSDHIASSDLSLGVPVKITISGTDFSAIAHVSDNYHVFEFEPFSIEKRLSADIYQQTKQFTGYMQSAGSLKTLCDLVADETRKIIGFDRVMVYQFDEQYNGHVISESRAEGIEPFYDLHYPHTDIPVQARALYMKNLLRIIVDVNYEPSPLFTTGEIKNLDLSHSVLRSVSPIHIQYLKNMGVGASMSISLIHKDRLWGLIACHHYSPRYISSDLRISAQLQGYFLTSQIAIRQHSEEYDLSLHTDKSLNILLEKLFSEEAASTEDIIRDDELPKLANASGVVMLLDEQIYSYGTVPPQADLRKLINWLHSYSSASGFSTDKLVDIYPESQSYTEMISGVIFQPLGGKNGNAILWFRKETIKEVTWAGNPDEAIIKTQISSISPRQSFTQWKEIRKSESRPWQKPELTAARNFSHAFTKHLHLIYLAKEELKQRKLNEKLRQATAELENLYWIGSHDLKEPLRKIQVSASRIMDEDSPSNLDQIFSMIKRMNDSAKRMQHLITDIISYSKLNSTEAGFERVNLNNILTEILEELKPEISEKKALLHVNEMPEINGIISFLQQLFVNLLRNSLKFTRPDIEPLIRINYEGKETAPVTLSEDASLFHKIIIVDNGIGFDNKFSESIFKVFTRLHAQSAYSGSGVGLALSRKIMTMHNGYISAAGIEGEGAVISLYFPVE